LPITFGTVRVTAVNASDLDDEVHRFYEGYLASYNRGDLDAYCACFGVPLSVVSGAVNHVYTAAAEIRGLAEAQQRSFARSDWSHSVIVAKRVWMVDGALAVIVADLQRVRASGEVYQTARCIYDVVLQGDGWKIVTVAQSLDPLPGSDGLLAP
jgi:hypothetical protein